MSKLKYLALVTALAVTGPASAGLVGQSVTSSLIFEGDPGNYFDPATVTIQDPDTEFLFDDGFATYSADFTDTTLTIGDSIYVNQASVAAFTMTFILNSGRFISVNKDSDVFNPNVTYSWDSTTLTIDWAGIPTSVIPQDFTAIFSIESESNGPSVPEPSILALMSLGLAGLGVFKRRRAATPA